MKSRESVAAENPSPTRPSLRTDLGLLLMVAIWAVNYSVIKSALAELPPLAFNALRFPLASLFVYIVLRRQGSIPLPERGDRGWIAAIGIIGVLVYQLLFIFGIDRTRAGNAALLLASSPILTALLSAAVGHERLGPRVWAGVAATVVGMTLVVLGGDDGGVGIGLDTLVGDLTIIAAAAVWSVYTVGARRPIERYGSLPVTAWTLWVGTAFLLPFGIRDLAALEWSAISTGAWAAVGFTGMFGIGLAYVLWYRGVERIGNTRTAIYSNLDPVLALLVAWPWLGEVPTPWQIVGAAVIIGGVMMARR